MSTQAELLEELGDFARMLGLLYPKAGNRLEQLCVAISQERGKPTVNPITFTHYGVRGGEIAIIAERIVSFCAFESNGNRGTCIHMDNGNEIFVTESPGQVRMCVEQAK